MAVFPIHVDTEFSILDGCGAKGLVDKSHESIAVGQMERIKDG